MAYITCRNLSLGYNSRPIVSGISFEVNKGDYLCIVGQNGAGKTTLMKTLLHLQDACGGEISTGDGLSPMEIGYLPQQTEVQRDFPASVWEVVLSGTLTRRKRTLFFAREQKALAEEMLHRLGIWELRNRSYRRLSGGQQQRTLLARALCATSKLLLLDEPVTGLDPAATQDLYQQIDALHRQGVAILMITHDLAAVAHATHILHIDGDHSFYGTREEYMRNPLWKRLREQEDAGAETKEAGSKDAETKDAETKGAEIKETEIKETETKEQDGQKLSGEQAGV